MIAKLPLESPLWRDFDGVEAEEMRVLLRQLAAAADGEGGDAWRDTWTDLSGGLMDDGVVADGAYAALPHLVEAAAALPPGRTVDFWVDLGFIVTADYRPPVPAGLEAGYAAALRLAERAAVRCLLTVGTSGPVCAQLALSCVALAGHPMGVVLWQLPDLRDGGLSLSCPACGSDTEMPDFFAAPAPSPPETPLLPGPPRTRREGHPWGEAAGVLREETLGEGWEPFLRVARDLAAGGVSPGTPGQAVLCLVAGIVAVRGVPQPTAGELARRLMSLTGHFRCWDCERTWPIADGLAETPDGVTLQHPPATATATATATAPARTDPDGPADGTPRMRRTVFSASVPGSPGSVDALAVVARPGRPPLVAGGGDTGVVCLWDATDGRLVHDPLPGHPDAVRSMTALPLPDGRVLVASGGDGGTIAVWDPLTGRPVREPAGDRPGGVTAMCAAAVPDGRTLLVTGTPRGVVRLWEPEGGECVGRLNPYGSPVRSLTAVPISAGHALIAASDTAGRVHVWDPAVEDPWDRGAAVRPSERVLADADHRVAAVAAVLLAGRTVLATADQLGAVMLWDPATGAPVGDGLPRSTGTAGPPLVTATTPRGGRTVLVVGPRHGRRLRVWEPETGAVRHIALDVSPTCLAAVGGNLIVGHDRGVLGLPLGGQ
ncbi:WD40 repeat domain-containing protein [Streptomyces sp. NPDC090080]|uniref:WD40 repeat domain-containing protein n=1 Tax=Streptomyces sp. NPDC090080 TaxID=3365939 RepID=UPI00382A566F